MSTRAYNEIGAGGPPPTGAEISADPFVPVAGLEVPATRIVTRRLGRTGCTSAVTRPDLSEKSEHPDE